MKNRKIPVIMSAFLFLSVLAASVFRADRMVWVFFDPNLKYIGGAMGLFLIFCFNIALLSCLIAIRIYKAALCERKIYKIAKVFSIILSAVLILLAAGIVIFGGRETNSVMLLYLKNDLPIIAAFVMIIILLIYFPALYGKGQKAVAVLVSVITALGFLGVIFPPVSFKITSEPAVFDTGSDYSVVFSTSAIGTGYIEYKYEGKDYKVYSEIDGRIIGDRLIHSVNIPYDHLKNNSYTVGSTKVTEEFSYGSRTGKTVTAGPFDFKVNESEKQSYLLVSDWHTYLNQAYDAVSHLDDYDAVLLLGDPSPGMDYEEQAVTYIVEFAGRLTKGEKPVVYVRGNHETRGKFASYLPGYLGYDKLYYGADFGQYSFVVLDSGEDKPDDHIEYGGLDDYYNNRLRMVDWFETYEPDNDKVIVLSHACQVSEPEEDLSVRAWDRMKEIGARAVLSGHTHECRFIDGRDDEEKELLAKYPGIVTYIDGGHSGKTYIASRLVLSGKGFKIEAVDNNGKQIVSENFEW